MKVICEWKYCPTCYNKDMKTLCTTCYGAKIISDKTGYPPSIFSRQPMYYIDFEDNVNFKK